jgi:hypothetical protein
LFQSQPGFGTSSAYYKGFTKMQKKFLLALIIGAMGAGGIFAQEKHAYIRPTISIGFAITEDFSGFAPSFDIDFVNDFGLTLGFQNVLGGNQDGVVNLTTFGAGYTYDGGKWCVGGKLMWVPVQVFLINSWGVGFDISGTYWFKNNLGFTGIMDIYFPQDFTIFSLRAGVSLRY